MRAIFQHMRYAELFGHYTRILGRLTRVFVIDEDARHADHVETSSRAATEESTPPLMPKTTREAGCLSICSTNEITASF